MEELSGHRTDVVDPFLEWHQALGGQELVLPHQEEIIAAAAANIALIPSSS